jgi:hypothetical protein
MIIGGLGVLLSLPRTVFVSGPSTFSPKLQLGYLSFEKLSPAYFVTYWFYNLGLVTILAPIGFFLAPRTAKKIFLAFIALFIAGNLVQFTIEIAGNHKLFNAFVIVANMFAALALWKLLEYAEVPFLLHRLKHKLTVKAEVYVIAASGVILTIVLIGAMTLSGVIDFFAIYNDRSLELEDYPKNQTMKWIVQNTSPSDLFLNTQYLYDPASVTGRYVWMGWPYFAWSQGLDTLKRTNELKDLFQKTDKAEVCSYLMKNNLKYVEITQPTEDFPFDPNWWSDNFVEVHRSARGDFIIYSVADSCIP